MSLPNYLAKIKSSGIYRFVWDKSQVSSQPAETLRLVVGYSEKGPFNTPVYVETLSDFEQIYGNISKRLERRGVYFHRLAQQALLTGPILALNLKPFDKEEIGYISFNPAGLSQASGLLAEVTTVFDRTRFWSLDPDVMVKNLKASVNNATKYITLAATDTKDYSNTVYIRKAEAESYKGITLRSWYATTGAEVPEWAEDLLDTNLSDYFAEIFVFRGDVNTLAAQGVEYVDSEDFKGFKSKNPLFNYFDYNREEDDMSKIITKGIKADYKNAFGEDADALVALSNDPNSNFIGSYAGIILPNFKDANGNYVSLDLVFNKYNAKHKMMLKLDESMLDSIEPADLQLGDSISSFYVPGYIYTSISKDKSWSGDELYKACMGVLKSEKGIRLALTNRVDVDYHYLIDTFDASKDNGKVDFFALAKEKDNAFAIVNFPKMSSFDIVGSPNGLKDCMDQFKLKMPGDIDGASYGAYYTQLTFTDGTVKSVIPSAALVSNLFMEKWTSRQPYYIVAGPNFGRISHVNLVGPDFNFSRADLDILEPMGVNAIVYVPRLGTYINSNQTAKQVPVSGLSKVHIRELVIYLQNEIESLLQSYQWELNTQALRDTIRSKADAICETIKNNGGLYAYVNICDGTNNTPEVIDNEMIILDTEIEPARGAGKMIHQLTIHKTGALSSTVK